MLWSTGIGTRGGEGGTRGGEGGEGGGVGGGEGGGEGGGGDATWIRMWFVNDEGSEVIRNQRESPSLRGGSVSSWYPVVM